MPADAFVFARQIWPQFAGWLTVYDFNVRESVIISFADGSLAKFEYAFYVQEGDYTVVYTEHNGYHVFRFGKEDMMLAGEERNTFYQPDPRGKAYWAVDRKPLPSLEA